MKLLAIDLEERTVTIDGLTKASYFLLASDEHGSTTDYHLGDAFKDTTYSDSLDLLPELHSERRSIASTLHTGYEPPVPPLLQYFSRDKLENTILNDKPANIHPGDELTIFRAFLKTLASIDAAISQDTQTQLTRIGNQNITPTLVKQLRNAYHQFFPYAA